jgi:hypothetical protein
MKEGPMNRTVWTTALPGADTGERDPREAAARRVERWALVAGVTGCTANGLLLALYAVALPGNHAYDWTGPANDVIGSVSGLAMIPMALGVRDLLGAPGRLPVLTAALAAGNAALAGASALLVTDVVELPVQLAVGVASATALLLWTRAVGHWGLVTAALPTRLSGAAKVIGGLGLAGLPVLGIGAALPSRSVPQYVVGGIGLALSLSAWLAVPIWQVRLAGHMSRRL